MDGPFLWVIQHHPLMGRRAGCQIHRLPPGINLDHWIGKPTKLTCQLRGVAPTYHLSRLPPPQAKILLGVVWVYMYGDLHITCLNFNQKGVCALIFHFS